MISRRIFLAGTGAVLLAAPLAAEAQRAGKVWRIGYLGTQGDPNVNVLRQSLRDLGYEEGRNLVIEYRWDGGNLDRLSTHAAELVSLKLAHAWWAACVHAPLHLAASTKFTS
jgi:putative ABC transport system substrate-binding protein